MRKAQIHFSNKLEDLTEVLKENLFPPGSTPFEQRLIAVPHLGLKSYLMQAIAKDPELQVAAGLQIVTLPQGFSKITRKALPTTLELSLFLQHYLLPLIETEEELKNYFKTASWEKRMGPFCDALARYFLRYAIYGKKGLSSWQEKLWKAMKQRWSFPSDLLSCYSKGQIHLFGFSFIPKSYFHFFLSLDATVYLFSPCEIFWADFYSEKERSVLTKELNDTQYDLFDQTFEDQNPLLANWGRVGRKMLNMVEEGNLIGEEHYVSPEGNDALQELQRSCLEGTSSKPSADSSITVFSATTMFREVEILKDYLLNLLENEGITPRDVQVFAPDISLYAPYIHAVFGDIPYGIYDLTLRETDPVARAFAKLIELPKKRFELEDVLQLLCANPFKQKWDLNVGQARKWLVQANVRWGFSKEQRRASYLQDIDEAHLVVNSEIGTWEYGLKRLVIGLGQIDGDALCGVEVTEMEQFDRLYTLLYSLNDDLTPLYDGTKWTIPTWLRYLGCLLESYFAIDPGHELYRNLNELASHCDRIDQEEVPFCSIERVIEQLLSKKGKSHSPPHLQSISFASLSEGCVLPGKVICLLGMQEEVFPGREENGSLYAGEIDYRPKRGDQDRYLLLQILLSARTSLFISYVRDETNKWGASPLLQELLSHIEEAKIIHHPAESFDLRYFQGELKSYNEEAFQLALAKIHPPKHQPLIKGFYEAINIIASTQQREIDIQKLFKFARHPLRYYLHEKLGIYPESSKGQGEYVLDPLSKYKLVREALKTRAEEVLEKAEKRGELPINLLEPLAKQQVIDEIQEWQEAMETFGILSDTVCTKKIDLQVGKYHLVGKLEFFTSKGLLVKGRNCLEDKLKFWPQGLILEKLGLPLLFVKDHKTYSPKRSLEHYLEYFVQAEEHPSPLLPEFGKALLQGTGADLKKALKQADDEVWNWLLMRDPLPNAEVIYRNWSRYLQEIFGGIDAKV